MAGASQQIALTTRVICKHQEAQVHDRENEVGNGDAEHHNWHAAGLYLPE